MKIWRDDNQVNDDRVADLLKEAWYAIRAGVTGRPVLTVEPSEDPKVAIVVEHSPGSQKKTRVTLADLGTVGDPEVVRERQARLPSMDPRTVSSVMKLLMG